MFKIHKQEIMWGGRPLILETGKLARQADGAVLATYGGTMVLATVVAEKKPREDIDFFPLTVHYQEKAFAAGKIPGGFFKREGKPNERETLTSRLIDRPVRPLFPEHFYNETQIICTVLSHDFENEPDILAMIAASAALSISGVPFLGPIGAARVAYIEDEYILNPTLEQVKSPYNKLELVVAGTREGVLMVESEAQELSEEIMLNAVMFGHRHFQPIIEAIETLAKSVGKERWPDPEIPVGEVGVALGIRQLVFDRLVTAYQELEKKKRRDQIDSLRRMVSEAFPDAHPKFLSSTFKSLEEEIVRTQALQEKRRIDGRNPTTVRPIQCEVGILKQAHGSAVFTRGETQALVVTTLGTSQDEQLMDELQGEYRESFMLHYNFPPYSVGETGRLGGPGRREIGHGKLAWRSVHPLLPSKETFPYTIRVVSEVLESNGSSSMATVCGASLSLMDAGVPLVRPVAGIAMGLIKEEDQVVVLSDISGDEDHLGDMDFKVAGTENGVTSLQMDLKITSIHESIMQSALAQAREGRLHILHEMNKAITQSRQELNEHAPRIITLMIPREKIREVIGSGGKVIREICEETGVKIDIEDDGKVLVSSSDLAGIEAAILRIKTIAFDPEVGTIYEGTVTKVLEFGAIVSFMGREGMVHISELAHTRTRAVEDVVQVGDTVRVKVLGFDRGKIRLSIKALEGVEAHSLSAGA